MRADFAVLLDACVLAEAAVSDLFLRLSEEPRLLLPKWTQQIWDETRRTCVEKLDWPAELAQAREEAATGAFPEAMITHFEPMIEVCRNHPRDRHVLAAAIHARVETIVTFNVKDFPPAALQPWGISAAHPADYMRVLYDHDPGVVVEKLHQMAQVARRDLPEMLARLRWAVPSFVGYVGQSLSVEVPRVEPMDWRQD